MACLGPYSNNFWWSSCPVLIDTATTLPLATFYTPSDRNIDAVATWKSCGCAVTGDTNAVQVNGGQRYELEGR